MSRVNRARGDSQHKVYPYLLRGLAIEKPNAIWGVGCPLDNHVYPLEARLDVSGGGAGLAGTRSERITFCGQMGTRPDA